MRCAVLAVPTGRGRDWTEQVRAWEDQGWHAVLVPDTLGTTSPFPALAAAAAVTSTLRLRSWVLAAPLRSPAATVREVSALQHLSDGRYELGIGTGRPDAAREAAVLGLGWPDAAGRIAHLEAVVTQVRREVSPAPPVVITAAGPRMITAALALVAGPGSGPQDRLAVATPPRTTTAALAEQVAQIRAQAPGPVPLTLQVFAAGDRIAGYLRSLGMTVQDLTTRGAVGLLPGTPEAAADALQEWGERYGADEVVVPVELADVVEPVLRLVAA
jgi:alkanesulfonate monooxygenase SsuD/methylene tetrahydromethanopterin reductase-like flavin-dependent oxidoreductase (luciferase family)